MTAGDDGVEQQLIQQLDALIDEGPDDELAAARGRRTLITAEIAARGAAAPTRNRPDPTRHDRAFRPPASF